MPGRSRSVAVATVVLMIAMTAPEAAAVAPLEGLSRSERSQALADMLENERKGRSAVFEDMRYDVMAYERIVQSFDSNTGVPLGSPAPGDVQSLAATGIVNLNMSVSISYDREQACCVWLIQAYFDCTGFPPNGMAGKDQATVMWANGLALTGDGAWGRYQGFTAPQGAISFNRADVVPNAGVNYEFPESYCCAVSYADFGWVNATIKRSTRAYETTNLVFKYFHTWQSLDYSVSISGTGPSATISPTTASITTAVYTYFTD